MVNREAFEAFVKSSFVQTKKAGSKVLTRSRGAEIVESATKEKVLWPTLEEEVQDMHDLSPCGFCQCFFISYIISLLEVFEEMCSKDEAYVT